MAKFDEGDKRWIAEERPDGTNVHNWHWSETDCLEYSRNFFTNSLTNLPILSREGEIFIKVTMVEKFTGESYVNIRKGKIIPGYELNVILSWEGEAIDESGNSILVVNGTVEIPYVSDENACDVPKIRVTISDDSVIGKRIKEAFLVKKSLIVEKVKEFEDVMAKCGLCRDELEAKKGEN